MLGFVWFGVVRLICDESINSAYQTGDIKSLPTDSGFDLICLFNVIDRCMNPLTLLSDIHDRMRDANSRLIVATPLPLRPSVEVGHTWVNPNEKLDSRGLTEWEDAAVALTINVFERAGYRVQCFSRVPYLSQGDTVYPFYVLDDAVFVLSSNRKTGYVKPTSSYAADSSVAATPTNTASAASASASGGGGGGSGGGAISSAAAALAAAAFDGSAPAGSSSLAAGGSDSGSSGDEPNDLPPLISLTAKSNKSNASAAALAEAVSRVTLSEPAPPESFDLPIDMTMSNVGGRMAAAADNSRSKKLA